MLSTSVHLWILEYIRLSKKFIKHPLEAVSVGDIVEVRVDSVDLKKKRIALSMVLD